jgi:hypothetical protein
MNSDTGIKPPLHRRFDKNRAMEFIRNRYRHCRNKIAKQVEVLQKDAAFREKCKEYYKRGYKDWVILTTILNCMINFKIQELGLKLPSEEVRNKYLELSNMLQNTVYPTNKFLENMDLQIKFHSILALNTYGFELRRKDFKPDVVEKFLRERMRHFDFDLPHKPLFGEPPGSWPKM